MRTVCPVYRAIDCSLAWVMHSLDWWKPTTTMGRSVMRGWDVVCSRIAVVRTRIAYWWCGLECHWTPPK